LLAALHVWLLWTLRTAYGAMSWRPRAPGRVVHI
jgi:hypothetical protein